MSKSEERAARMLTETHAAVKGVVKAAEALHDAMVYMEKRLTAFQLDLADIAHGRTEGTPHLDQVDELKSRRKY